MVDDGVDDAVPDNTVTVAVTVEPANKDAAPEATVSVRWLEAEPT